MYLENVKVLDLSRILAGPFATQTLGDLGADILKVEAPSGDDTRHWGPPFQQSMSAYFQCCNRNKASLVLDLKQEEDRVYFRKLVEKADVVVDNFPPKVRVRLGLGQAELKALNPSVVTMSITGYAGTRVHEAGYDVMIQAEAGLMAITGPEKGAEYKTGVALVDVLTGTMAVNGILAALFRKERKGIGAHLSISLYQTALISLINVATSHLVSGRPASRWGNRHPNIVPYQVFKLKDRAVILGAANDKQFRRLCKLLGICDPKTQSLSNAERVAKRDELVIKLSDKLKSWDSETLGLRLKEAQIPMAPILKPEEALRQAEKWNPDALIAVNHQELGSMTLVGSPLVGDGMRKPHLAPPSLNERGREFAEIWLREGG